MSGWIVYLVAILTIAGFYGILAMILNFEAGWGGLWDLGLSGLLALGAYVLVVSTLTDPESGLAFAPGWPMWAGITAAAVVAGCVALLVGTPALRLRGEYFLITTFAFSIVVQQLAINEQSLTNGTVGIVAIDRPLAGSVASGWYGLVLLGIVVTVGIVIYLLMRRIAHSPHGRLLRGMRDNEPLALALGKPTARLRIKTFVFAAILFGAVAPLYVWYVRSINPGLFNLDVAFVAWTALVVGGMGSIAGPALGAVVFIAVTEALEFIPVSAEHATLVSASRPLLLGAALILILRFRPEGIVPERRSFAWAARASTVDAASSSDGRGKVR